MPLHLAATPLAAYGLCNHTCPQFQMRSSEMGANDLARPVIVGFDFWSLSSLPSLLGAR